MRRIVTGVDEAGRSCVVKETAYEPRGVMPGVNVMTLFETEELPLPARPPGRGAFVDLGLAPGRVRWNIIDWVPGFTYPMHHTDTVDVHILLSGSLELTLDDGPHPLEPGDCVVMTGVDHAWRAGPEGCRLSTVMVGTPPPPR